MIRPTTQRRLVRLVAIAVAAVAIQVGAIGRVQLLGVGADVLPLVVGAVGLMTGPPAGACFGFGIGLLTDLALGGPLGLSSFLYVLLGYMAGRIGERGRRLGAVAVLTVGGSGIALTLGVTLIPVLLELSPPVRILGARETLGVVALNLLLALPVQRLTHLWLAAGGRQSPARRRAARTSWALEPALAAGPITASAPRRSRG